VGKSGRARKLRGAQVTASHAYKVGAVVCVHAKAMKEPWCLAVSNAEASTAMQVNYYAKLSPRYAGKPLLRSRWTIEPNFRDTKDLGSAWGMVPRASANQPGATVCCSSTHSPWCC
jgi:hypothetical protein